MDPNSNMGAYGAVTVANYPPTEAEAFAFPAAAEEPYFTDAYDLSPMGGFFDCDSYFTTGVDGTLSPPALTRSSFPSVASPTATVHPNLTTSRSAFSNSVSPASPTYPFGVLDSTTNGFTFSPRSPQGPESPQPTSTASSSRRPSLKREPTDSESAPNAPSRPARKRGRPPRLSQQGPSDSPTTSSSNNANKSRRLPHNQVERKYRENLNAEMERLRRAIPHLALQGGDGAAIGQPKPSKAMVLAGAIEYIQRVERERDELRLEVERLRAMLR